MLNFKSSAWAKVIAMLKRYIKRAFCIRKTKTCAIRKRSRMSAAIISVSCLIGFAVFSANFSIGYTVMVEDKVVGTVATKSEYYEILDEVKTEVEEISDIEFAPKAEVFSVEIISKDDFTEKKELIDNIKATSEEMAEAYIITSDEKFVAALNTEEEANSLVDCYLEKFAQAENVEVSYATEVKVEAGHAPKSEVMDYDAAYEKFEMGECITHTVAEEETTQSIAELYAVDEEQLISDNEISELIVGATLKIYTKNPIIPIKTVEHINGEIEIPYETIEKEDSTIYEGQTRTEVSGVNGKKYLHAYITRVNGIVTQENIIKSEEITPPTTAVILVGTKTPPPSVGTKDFIMPASGRLSSTFGKRWGRLHAGIDIAASTGTPIYASDNGIVVESEYQSNGYGNIVKIDHQNGFVTYYAHCSKLLVNVGDVVAKGDKIATIGNTGRSTGSHLHFEIRENGTPYNPFNYIKK